MTVPSDAAMRVSTLPKNAPTRFALTPEAAEMDALAQALELSALRKLSFRGEVRPAGKHDWVLSGHLGATVVQPCSLTLAPVTTRIEEQVTRRFTPHLPEEDSDAEEVEMPEDETLERLGTHIDPAEVMAEALALALPLYPRADGAEMGGGTFTQPGQKAMTDDDARPLANLADLLKAREARKEGEGD